MAYANLLKFADLARAYLDSYRTLGANRGQWRFQQVRLDAELDNLRDAARGADGDFATLILGLTGQPGGTFPGYRFHQRVIAQVPINGPRWGVVCLCFVGTFTNEDMRRFRARAQRDLGMMRRWYWLREVVFSTSDSLSTAVAILKPADGVRARNRSMSKHIRNQVAYLEAIVLAIHTVAPPQEPSSIIPAVSLAVGNAARHHRRNK